MVESKTKYEATIYNSFAEEKIVLSKERLNHKFYVMVDS